MTVYLVRYAVRKKGSIGMFVQSVRRIEAPNQERALELAREMHARDGLEVSHPVYGRLVE